MGTSDIEDLQYRTYAPPTTPPLTVQVKHFLDYVEKAAAQSVLEKDFERLEEVVEAEFDARSVPEDWSFEVSVFVSDELGIGRVTHAAVFVRIEDGESELIHDYSYGVGASDVRVNAAECRQEAETVVAELDRH